MEVVSFEKVDLNCFNKNSECEVYFVHVQIKNVRQRADEIATIISNKNWIKELVPELQDGYNARINKTIDEIVNNILSKVEDKVTEDFGEYLVSVSAQESLVNSKAHVGVPLAELLGKKKTGNSGFDFHTITHNSIIAFGEAKYTRKGNKHCNAISQICQFIKEEKDLADILYLRDFAEKKVITKLCNGEKAYIAAFSLNGKRYKQIFNGIIKRSKLIDKLLLYPELYLIGVEVCQ